MLELGKRKVVKLAPLWNCHSGRMGFCAEVLRLKRLSKTIRIYWRLLASSRPPRALGVRTPRPRPSSRCSNTASRALGLSIVPLLDRLLCHKLLPQHRPWARPLSCATVLESRLEVFSDQCEYCYAFLRMLLLDCRLYIYYCSDDRRRSRHTSRRRGLRVRLQTHSDCVMALIEFNLEATANLSGNEVKPKAAASASPPDMSAARPLLEERASEEWSTPREERSEEELMEDNKHTRQPSTSQPSTSQLDRSQTRDSMWKPPVHGQDIAEVPRQTVHRIREFFEREIEIRRNVIGVRTSRPRWARRALTSTRRASTVYINRQTTLILTSPRPAPPLVCALLPLSERTAD